MTVIRIRPKSTAVREAWQWTGQPRDEWPEWVRSTTKAKWHAEGEEILILRRRSGNVIVFHEEWLVRDLDSADVIQYTDAELWKENERS
jgi:hypothetical protein